MKRKKYIIAIVVAIVALCLSLLSYDETDIEYDRKYINDKGYYEGQNYIILHEDGTGVWSVVEYLPKDEVAGREYYISYKIRQRMLHGFLISMRIRVSVLTFRI